jgi:hypothetical protein
MYVNVKMISVETIPGIGRGGMKERSGGGVNAYMIYLIHLRTFVNATMFPLPAQV